MMMQGRISAEAMITEVVSLAQVPAVFEALKKPTNQCKVLINLDLD